MFPSTRPRRRQLAPLALIAVLAVTAGWSNAARATSHMSASSFDAMARVAGAVDIAGVTAASRAPERDAGWEAAAAAHAAVRSGQVLNHRRAFSYVEVVPEPEPAAPKPVKVKAPKPPAPAPKEKSKPTYQGTNHFWVPSLGMSYGVRWYACGRTTVPGNHIYRWGCAGRNNVYLLGHAWGVMKPLHDLYVRGGLRRGMVAIYADANGRVRKYKVTEWRVVRPTETAWQTAAQPVPSMTLQTCIGKNSEWRLNVRLVVVR
ncbi:MAG TPA: sortase [Candidatus Limnocylindrales bacterium]|nr:sortase [Candidatus Limnocylindrales bacterium]